MVHMPHWPKKFAMHPEAKDLSRMLAILAELDNPHLKLPPTIHIAGTNGKGSTCAMLRSIYKNMGLKVHMYTSPHLLHFYERIELHGQKIDDDFLFEVLELTRIASEKLDFEPTFFESTTAAAFLAFSKIPADILILETGMGGRLDPTNVIPNPILTIITPISYDHMEYLGEHIRLIAGEKAGIIKPGVPCVISRQDQDVMDILLAKCEELNSPSIAYEYDFIPEKNEEGFYFRSQLAEFQVPHLNLKGDHQIINASSVIAGVLVVAKTRVIKIMSSLRKQGSNQHFFEAPLQLDSCSRRNDIEDDASFHNDVICAALAKAEWPGRLQEFNISKIVKNAENASCYLDGAHNISGAAALADWIKEQQFKQPILIVGLTKNRDVSSFLSQFKEVNPIIYGVRVLSEPSSYSSEMLAQKAAEANIEVIPKDSLEEALAAAVAHDNSAKIIVTGSLFLVSDCMKLLAKFA